MWTAFSQGDVPLHVCSTDVPYALFGHSMGAWVAYEMTKVSCDTHTPKVLPEIRLAHCCTQASLTWTNMQSVAAWSSMIENAPS
jgi:hypothetical protein